MLGRTVEVRLNGDWEIGIVKEVETGVQGNSMEVRLLPCRERILPAYVVVAPESEGELWRECSKQGGRLDPEPRGNTGTMKTIGRGAA